MSFPWKIVEYIATPKGPLELRQRGERDFLITIGPCVLMNTGAPLRSHLDRAVYPPAAPGKPRVLVGGSACHLLPGGS